VGGTASRPPYSTTNLRRLRHLAIPSPELNHALSGRLQPFPASNRVLSGRPALNRPLHRTPTTDRTGFVPQLFPKRRHSSTHDAPNPVTVQSPYRGCSDERGKRVAAGVGGEQVAQVNEQRSALQSAGDRGGQCALDEALAVLGSAAVGELAVDDRAAERALGGIVRVIPISA
jgi:hypothetical protein